MTDRGLPIDGAPACPFVAFEDDRDARSTAPDHRHRCYAEARPAPRALAHQEAYCLSSAFPVCPTFQDWARREAAAARPGATPPPVIRSDTELVRERAMLPPPERAERHPVEHPPPLPPHRPAHRDWAAPPPWLSDDAPAVASTLRPDRAGDPATEVPGFLAGRPGAPTAEEAAAARGLSGSVADRWASGGAPDDDPAAAEPPRAASWAAAAPGPSAEDDERFATPPPRLQRRERLPAERPSIGRAAETPSGTGTGRHRRPDAPEIHGPSWEQPRRHEAYPAIKAPMGLPDLSPVLIGIAALGLAALGLFFLPALLGVGGDDEPGASPTPSTSSSATPTPEPTPTPAPTPTVHVVAAGDTLSKIATQYGLSLDELLAANPQITNPNRINLNDEIIIPLAATPPPDEVGGEASPSPSP